MFSSSFLGCVTIFLAIRLSSILRTWYFYCELDFRILAFRLKMLSSSTILVFPVWSFLVYPTALLRDFSSVVSIFVAYFVVCYSPYFRSACKCKYRHGFMKLYLCLFSYLVIQRFTIVMHMLLNLFIFISKYLLFVIVTVPQVIRTTYLFKYVIIYHYFSSHIHLSFHRYWLCLRYWNLQIIFNRYIVL
jgi:hypothetical protein